MTTALRRVAAIDCGTNTVRLLITEEAVIDGMRTWTDIRRQEEIVRLGEGVDASGRLTAQAIDRVWQALVEFKAVIRAEGVIDIRMVATSAARDARNVEDFAAMVDSVLGVAPLVLSGRQEATLGFLGATAGLGSADGSLLLIDIGGGSTELALGTVGSTGADPALHWAESVDAGAVRITERCLPGDPPTDTQVERARAVVAETFAAPIAALRRHARDRGRRIDRVVAVAGTALTLGAGALRHRRWDATMLDGQVVAVDALLRTGNSLLAATRAHRAALGYVLPGRVDVIGGGAVILQHLLAELAAFGVQEITLSEHDLLDGLARIELS